MFVWLEATKGNLICHCVNNDCPQPPERPLLQMQAGYCELHAAIVHSDRQKHCARKIEICIILAQTTPL